jgi:hypothetical protein
VSTAEDPDSLLRELAAAPPREPPALRVSAIAVAPLDRADELERVRTRADRFGGTFEIGAEGVLLVTMRDEESVSRAANLTLALVEAHPRARIALVTAPTTAGAVDGATALLKRKSAPGASLDEATAQLLDSSFEVRGAGAERTLIARRGPAQRVDVAGDSVDTASLALTRSGLRFLRRETEVGYMAWALQKAIPFTRVGTIMSISNWLLMIVIIGIAYPSKLPRALAQILLVPVPVIVATLAITYRPKLIRWVPRGTVLGNMLAGFTAVGICFWIASVPELGSGGVCIVAFFAFTIFRMPPLQALVAVIPYAVFNQVLLVEALRDGTLSFGTVVISTTLAVEALISGLLACVTIDRISRDGYRQERIVAMQGEIIDRLHKAEVQRQVAERSRGLSEALARLTETPRAPIRLSPGDIVEERYRIVRAIGSGGMGQVHEVERLTDRRRLALKTLTTVADRQALARFAREAQVAAELDHRNVVAALDIGVTPSGTPFLVMDLVLGSSLAAERSRFGDARWALPILTQIAKALSAMHAHGIVHRDLKPSNVLLDGDLVKVADFGLAGLLVEHAPLAMTRPPNEDSPALTLTGAIMGTPLYMAPELVRGAREAGPSVDLYSFGVVAYELLSARLPYAVPPLLERLSGRNPPAPVPLTQSSPHLDAQLCTLVDGCLALAPDARPTAEAVAVALAAL